MTGVAGATVVIATGAVYLRQIEPASASIRRTGVKIETDVCKIIDAKKIDNIYNKSISTAGAVQVEAYLHEKFSDQFAL